MIADVVMQVAKTSLFTSILVGILLLMVPLLQKRYRAKWRYIAWLIIAVRLLIPLNVSFPHTPVNIELPEQKTLATVIPPSDEHPYVEMLIPAYAKEPATLGNEALPEIAEEAAESTFAVTALDLAGVTWVVGTLIFLLFQICSYQTFLRKLKSSQIGIVPDTLKETIRIIGTDMGIRKLPEPIITDVIDAPVLIGILNPRILFPHSKYTVEEITFILRHELVHYRRRDMWYKLTLLLANAVHWFNPIVYLMTVQAAKDIELVCDDDVIRELDHDARARYGDTILSALPKKRRLEPLFSTHFGSAKENMKGRLCNLFDMAAKRRGIAALCTLVVCALTLTGFVTFGYTADKTDDISATSLPKAIIKNVMIHARSNDDTWAAASSIEGKTWEEQIGAEIKWIEDAYKGYNTRFVITESLPKTEATDVSRIGYLYENSAVFRSMSQMKDNTFIVENGQSFSRFGAAYNLDMMQRTAIMVDNDDRLTLDINYTLTEGKLAVWLIDPDGKTVYQGDLKASYKGEHTVSGKKGLWSVITVNSGNNDGSMSGNISIILRQTVQTQTPIARASNLSIQSLGTHTLKDGDTLSTSLQWDNGGDAMFLYTDKNYNDDEILFLMRGLPGVPVPDYSKVNRTEPPPAEAGGFGFAAEAA